MDQNLADESGVNVTIWFEACFTSGFVIHVVNFCIFAFIEPYGRTLIKQRRPMGPLESLYQLFALIIEIMIRLVIYIASILYLILLLSSASVYCTRETGTLRFEGIWLIILTFTQTILNTVTAVWKVKMLSDFKQNVNHEV